MFKLGNFAVKEILYGVAQNFNDDLLYSLDQLTSASIEVSSDPTEITDKNGNVIRSIYNSKTATFTASSAMISPALLNANSGSEAKYATKEAAIQMPKIMVVKAGETISLPDLAGTVIEDLFVPTSIQVMGIYNNGANGDVLKRSASASLEKKEYGFIVPGEETPAQIIVPEAGKDAPTQYLVKYERNVESGIQLMNTANQFPDTVRLTLFAAVMDPCEDTYKAAYIYIPSFQPDPSVTISLDVENQEMDFSGNINVDFCSDDKVLYYIYFVDEDVVTSGATA